MRPLWGIAPVVIVAGLVVWLLLDTDAAPPASDAVEPGATAPAAAPSLAAPARAPEPTDPWRRLLRRLRDNENAKQGGLLFDELMERHRATPLTIEELLELALLPAKEDYTRWARWARGELRDRREEANPHLPRVLELLAHDDAAQRAAAAGTIAYFAPLEAAHVPLMVKALDPEPIPYVVGRNLVNATKGMGAELLPLAPHFIRFVAEVLKSRNEEERNFAGSISWDHVEYDVDERLAAMGPDAIPVLLEAIERYAAERRKAKEHAEDGLDVIGGMWNPTRWCVRTLREFGPEEAAPVALQLLRHDDPEVRGHAGNVLEGLKLKREDIRLQLEADLRATDPGIRRHAAQLLRTQGTAAAEALQEALADEDKSVRKAAARSLAELGVRYDSAVASLIAVVEGRDMFKALTAARTIVKWGPKAAGPAMPTLIRAWRGDDWHDLRLAKLLAPLVAKDPGILQAAFADGAPLVQAGVAQTIRRLPTLDASSKQILEQAIRSRDRATRIQAAAALARHGERGHMGVLADGLASGNQALIIAAAEGLVHYGREATSLLPKLMASLEQAHKAGGYKDDIDGALTDAIRVVGAFDLDFMRPLLVHESVEFKVTAMRAFQRAGLQGLARIEQAWPEASSDMRSEMLDVASGLLRRTGVGPGTRDAAWQIVVRASEDPAAQVRKESLYQLAREVGTYADALDLLVARIGDSSDDVAGTATYLIKERALKVHRVRAVLEEHRDHKNAYVRRNVRAILDRLDK